MTWWSLGPKTILLLATAASVLVSACAPSPSELSDSRWGGSWRADGSGVRLEDVRARAERELSLRLVSPLQGEWLHEQSCRAVVEVWAPAGRAWEDVLRVQTVWQGGAASSSINLTDWEDVWVPASELPGDDSGRGVGLEEGGASPWRILRASASVRLLTRGQSSVALACPTAFQYR